MIRLQKLFVPVAIVSLLLGTIGSVFAQSDALVIWADDTRAPILEDLGALFEAEFGIAVVVQELGFGDIRDQLKTAAPAGEGPDIIIGAHDWLGELVVSGLLAPIDLSDIEDELFEPAVLGFNYNGVQYGLPYSTDNVAFVINPELVPEAPATWDDVKTISEQLIADGASQYGYIIQDNDPYHFYPIQTAFGGYVFGRDEDDAYDPSDVGIDSAGAVAAAEWLESMRDLMPTGVDYDVMHALFEEGDAAMITTGPWAVPRIEESGVPFQVVALPGGPAGDARPFLGVQGFMISAFSDNQLLAEAFLLDFVATEETMQALFDVDPRPSAWLSVREAIDDDVIAGFVAAGDTGEAMPAIPAMSAVWTAWGNAMQLVRQGQQSGDEAFESAGEQIRTLLAEAADS